MVGDDIWPAFMSHAHFPILISYMFLPEAISRHKVRFRGKTKVAVGEPDMFS